MGDDKDAEIAELKARLERLERPAPITPVQETKSGFSGGFFGCFGALAAVLVVIAAFLSLGQCAQDTPHKAQPVDSPYRAVPVNYNQLMYAGFCTDALNQAADMGLVSRDRAALAFPWAITRAGGTDAQPNLICEITDGDERAAIEFRAVCQDEGRAACAKFMAMVAPPSTSQPQLSAE